MSKKNLKELIIKAGYKAIEELIQVAESPIFSEGEEGQTPDLSADRLKNAAAAKKLAVFDAFEILARINQENESEPNGSEKSTTTTGGGGFAEQYAKS